MVRLSDVEQRVVAVEDDLKKIRKNMHETNNELSAMQGAIEILRKSVEESKNSITSVQQDTSEILSVLHNTKSAFGVIRKHGPRAIAAIMGAAIYAGFIDANNPIARFFHALFT